MAPAPQAAEAAAAQQAAQHGLAVVFNRAMTNAWQVLDVDHLKVSLPKFTTAVLALTTSYGQASGKLGADYYTQSRGAANITGRFHVPIVKPAPIEQVAKTVGWATKDLWSPTPDLAATKDIADPAFERLVLDVGRNTVIGAVHADAKARGWARRTEPDPCHFCSMLASRGAVYRTERSAEFKPHDNCRCIPEPFFNAYEPSADVRQWQALWARSTRGKSGKAAVLAFRQAYEGRTPAAH